jgi:hypothetical protein
MTTTDDGWRPIETAPKDGTRVLLHGHWANDHIGDFRFGYWFTDDGTQLNHPTHWLPLPLPPPTPHGANRRKMMVQFIPDPAEPPADVIIPLFLVFAVLLGLIVCAIIGWFM